MSSFQFDNSLSELKFQSRLKKFDIDTAIQVISDDLFQSPEAVPSDALFSVQMSPESLLMAGFRPAAESNQMWQIMLGIMIQQNVKSHKNRAALVDQILQARRFSIGKPIRSNNLPDGAVSTTDHIRLEFTDNADSGEKNVAIRPVLTDRVIDRQTPDNTSDGMVIGSVELAHSLLQLVDLLNVRRTITGLSTDIFRQLSQEDKTARQLNAAANRQWMRIKTLSDAYTGMICRSTALLEKNIRSTKKNASQRILCDAYFSMTAYLGEKILHLLKPGASKDEPAGMSVNDLGRYIKADFATNLFSRQEPSLIHLLVTEMESILHEIPTDEDLRENMRIWFDAVGGMISGIDEIKSAAKYRSDFGADGIVLNYAALIIGCFEIMEQGLQADKMLHDTSIKLSLAERAFYQNKLTAVEFFVHNELPFCEALFTVIRRNSDSHLRFILS